MALSFSVTPGYSFSDSEKVTYSKLNLLGSPVITLDGQAESGEIADGAITTAKLDSTVDINSKVADHNLALTKLASGTHGQVLYYDTNGDLVTLGPGTAGNFLKTNGPAADPEWAAQAGAGTIAISQITTAGANKLLATDASNNVEWRPDTGLLPSIASAGSVAYFNGSAWVALGLGANGETLQSNGTAPVWDASSSTSFSAKGRFATVGVGTVTFTGATNIASATWTNAASVGTLTVVFTSSVPVDLPIFMRVENVTSPSTPVFDPTTNARTTSGLTVVFGTSAGANYAINVMITT
jgi:hypothetical protein